MAREPEVVKAFRDTWELGIHSYLTYLREWFVAARELLTKVGSIFVRSAMRTCISKAMCWMRLRQRELLSLVTFKKTSGRTEAKLLGDQRLPLVRQEQNKQIPSAFVEGLAGLGGSTQLVRTRAGRLRGDADGNNRPRDRNPTHTTREPEHVFDVVIRIFRPPARPEDESPDVVSSYCRVVAVGKAGHPILTISSLPSKLLGTVSSGFGDSKIYVVQTNSIIERCMHIATDPGDLVLDPTCGSGTTAHVAEQWGRRWITMDTSRVALALARTRLMSARFPYYLLSDSPDGAAKERDLAGIAEMTAQPAYSDDVRKGFVYRRVPHVTLKSIANNEEIDEIHVATRGSSNRGAGS